MKVGIMQPYFLPYIGYYQLIAAVDIFVVYDNIKYTKKGWVNRNRMLLNGVDSTFSLPLRKASDSLDVVEREISSDFNCSKMLGQFKGSYGRAPYFDQTYELLKQILEFEDKNLFNFIYNSLKKMCDHLGIDTEIRVSSEIDVDHGLKAQSKVLAICEAVQASTYINTIGGVELYSKRDFESCGLTLNFIKTKPFEYRQFGTSFLPWLSIIDVLMFNQVELVRANIANNYEII